MIQQLEQQDWQQSLQQVITDWDELCGILSLNPQDLPLSKAATAQFPLRVPREFVARMGQGDPQDPLLLQILPLTQEARVVRGYQADPLEEAKANPVPGLLHKYHGRVLLTLAGSCPINCRYCFRRHFPYESNVVGRAGWQQKLDYIAADKNISEVILSGGEPLLMKDQLLFEFVAQLDQIQHVKTLRFHTRMPIVIPSRITAGFIDKLKKSRFKKVMVLHCNHPNEIDQSVKAMVAKLKHADITVLNQSVLLKDVNNDVAVLKQLSEKLFDAGCLPYYIHLLDRVAGAAHFDVPILEVQKIKTQLQALLPGYLMPKFALEVPGEKNKVSF